MSATASPPSDAAPTSPAPAGAPIAGEACPLCGAALHPEQEWCLRCGAAARTRLAASPNWKTPIAAVLVLLALSLGVLAAALVKLAGDTGPVKPASTTTVTRAATPTPTVVAPQNLAPATTAPSARTPTVTTPATTTRTGATRQPGAGTTGLGTTGLGTTRPRTGTASPRTGSPGNPVGGLGLGKAVEERIRKLATKRANGGK
jgi:hypothetical protein